MKLDKKFAEALTNALINKIKAIEVEHHEVPWFDNVAIAPRNLDGQAYKGLNRFLLSWLGGHREVPVYMTFLRAKKEGLNVLSGEKSIPIQYGNKVAFHKETNKSITIDRYNELTADEKKDYNVAYMLNHYNVFNIEQTNVKEVKPELYERLKAESIAQSRAITASNKPLDTLVEQQRWYTPIRLDQVTEAFYRPSTDTIHLPKREFFKSDDLFYSTMLHEMSHSTGHESRLNRDMRGASFGSSRYAREELVAELSSAIVGQQYNVSKHILEGNAQYLKSWLGAIDKEPDFLNNVLGDVMKASDMIIERVEEVQKENIDRTMHTQEPNQIEKPAKRGKSAYDLQAQYSRINGEYPTSATTDREKQIVHRIKQAESIIKVYNENISKYLGENYYQDKDKVYQVIPKEIYASSKVMERTTEQREYDTEQKSNEVNEPAINYEAVPVVEVYSDERLMTTASVSQRSLSLPSDIISSIEDREQVLKELEVTYSPDQEKELLEKKMRLEDDIRSRIRTYLAANYLLNLSPGISYNEKMKSLEQIKAYAAYGASEQRMLHDGLNDKLPVVVTIDNTEENRNKLDDNYIEYEILPSNKLKYRGVARLQEGYALENTPANLAFLEDNGISYSQIKGRKLFVSLRAQKIALLLASTALLSPVIGLAVMYTMNKLHILDKLLENKQFSKEEAEKLNQGATLRKETVENGRKVEKYYFVDSGTNKLRSIPVHEVQLPHRVNGVELSVKELDDLRNGRTVVGFNEASGKYYEAKLNLNNKKAIDMGFKDLKAEKEFKYVPKPNSPDAEKIAYVQAHGAQGVNDIWEMGGVNLERDSFLDKYDVEGFYKDYLSATQDKDQARAKELSESIQNNVSRQESLGISR